MLETIKPRFDDSTYPPRVVFANTRWDEFEVTTYGSIEDGDQVVSLGFWDPIENCPIAHIEMNAQTFQGFKDYINSL